MGSVMIERPGAGASRDADIRTYPVKAGENVQAGDVVDVVGGGVGSNWRKKPNEATVFANTQVTRVACAALENGAIVAWNGINSGIEYSVGRVNGNALLWGTRINVGNNYTGLACQALSANNFVVVHVNGVSQLSIMVWSADPNTLTAKKIADTTANPSSYNSLVALSDTKFSLITELGGVRLTVFDVSGSMINSVATSNLPGGTSSNYLSACRLSDLGSSKRVCVCYQDAGDGNKGKAVVATISTSNVVTWGTPVVFNTDSTSNISCCRDGECAIVTYAPNGNISYARVLSLVGTTLTVGAALAINATGVAISLKLISDDRKIVLSYYNAISGSGDTGGGGFSVVLKRSGSQLTKGTPYRFNAMGTPYMSADVVDGNRIICAYTASLNSDYGTATLLEVRGDQVAGGIENAASQAIALQSGTGGQSIDVIFDGTAELPGITAGTSITSSGVQGYSPQDGWLWVNPEWEKHTRISTGGYIGTNTGGPNAPSTLMFDFEPYMVFIMGGGGNSTPGTAILMRPFDGAMDGRNDYNGAGGRGYCFFEGKKVSWYALDVKTQMNQKYDGGNYPYRYVAIG